MSDTFYEKTINLQRQNQELKAKLEEAVELKLQVERELYAKFVSVLNEKKRKIRELQEAVELGNVRHLAVCGPAITHTLTTTAVAAAPLPLTRAQGMQGSPSRSDMMSATDVDGADISAGAGSDSDDEDGGSMMMPPPSSQRSQAAAPAAKRHRRDDTASQAAHTVAAASQSQNSLSLSTHQTLSGVGQSDRADAELDLEDRL